MRTLLKIAAAGIAMLVLLLGALAALLPRLVKDEDLKVALAESAEAAVGSPVEWRSMDVGLLPPRLVIESPVLRSAVADEQQARLSAESIDLRLAWWRLVEWRIAVDSLVIHGAELVLTRTDEGLVLPFGGAEEEQDFQDGAGFGGAVVGKAVA